MASQGDDLMCGGGFILFLSQQHFFKVPMGIGGAQTTWSSCLDVALYWLLQGIRVMINYKFLVTLY